MGFSGSIYFGFGSRKSCLEPRIFGSGLLVGSIFARSNNTLTISNTNLQSVGTSNQFGKPVTIIKANLIVNRSQSFMLAKLRTHMQYINIVYEFGDLNLTQRFCCTIWQSLLNIDCETLSCEMHCWQAMLCRRPCVNNI